MKWSEEKRQKARFILALCVTVLCLLFGAVAWTAAIGAFVHGVNGLAESWRGGDAAGSAVAVWFLVGGLLLSAFLSNPMLLLLLNLPAMAVLVCCAVFSLRQRGRRPVALCTATAALSAAGLAAQLCQLLLTFLLWY